METPLIDWEGSESQLLVNPRLAPADRARLQMMIDRAPQLDAHVWLATSGTTGASRLVALSKEAMLASAVSVNQYLGVERGDVWCRVLPPFHVGGLAIHARAHLSQSPVIEMTWDAAHFVSVCATEAVAFASLVPAQLFDLVRAHAVPPRGLRAAIVGGSAVPQRLYHQACTAGWPLVMTYGMTECSSQVATATVEGGTYVLLPHIAARMEDDGRISFRGPSLLTGYADDERFWDPKVEGWFVSDDVGELDGRMVRIRFRLGDVVKIGGEMVDLQRLDALLEDIRGVREAAVFATPDERLGWVIHLATTAGDVSDLVEAFNARVAPFERIRAVHQVPTIPRSPMGKLLRARLTELVSPSPAAYPRG